MKTPRRKCDQCGVERSRRRFYETSKGYLCITRCYKAEPVDREKFLKEIEQEQRAWARYKGHTL